MTERILEWSPRRAILSLTNGIRLVFGGAAGGVGYQIIRSNVGISPWDIGMFFILVGMTGIVEYALISSEPDPTAKFTDAMREELRGRHFEEDELPVETDGEEGRSDD